ncbi:Gfo/Idh/MocA family oxidoreductase [Haloechinothrix sp. YIM 98757]|uniref:Inositol 2-dehydrogenase n=1 Tax=Haloechinothrix aidingensis TaxID=2752311 RepID=A0A837ZWP7_9PSEU|nr:Gfo/Idh/MocA family oxidoreductase [Haloechinothrix aidingensis]MBA0124554.1 Gfo/Idh/MocA family oxidoreductase [Haloechinothrix aidingensis]
MTVQVGVIGTGMIGQEHIRRLTDTVAGARVSTVSDVDTERAKEVASGVDARAVDTGQEVIDDPAVDAVLVTSWGPTHAEYVLAAIEAGKYVFCEKPLATTAEDCRRIVDAEMARGRRLVQVGFMRRYDPGYRAMKDAIDSGSIGAALLMHCAHRNATVPETYHSEMATHDTAIHEIDTVRWLLNEEIRSAQVLKPRTTSLRFEHLQDPQILLFETAGGVRVDVEVFVNCQYGYDIRCETVGERGTLTLPDPHQVVLRSDSQVRTHVHQHWKTRFAEAFDVEFQEWVGSVLDDEIAGPSSWDGYAAAVTADATVQALHSGRVVDVPLPERPAFYA